MICMSVSFRKIFYTLLLAGVQESHSSDRPSVGFDPDPYRSGTRFNHFRASDAETDRLRCALREEQERVRV